MFGDGTEWQGLQNTASVSVVTIWRTSEALVQTQTFIPLVDFVLDILGAKDEYAKCDLLFSQALRSRRFVSNICSLESNCYETFHTLLNTNETSRALNLPVLLLH